jgi:hypothetical protein
VCKDSYKNFFVSLICLSLCAFVFLTACKKNGQIETSDILNFSDDTTEAARLVADANEDLNKIKVLYKHNEDKREELKSAMKDNDAEKVKKIADDLVYIINDGMALGESAIGKIEKAQEMNINADFNQYLSLKVQSLRKQMDAFENYRQAARFLRDGYTPKDDKQHASVKLEFAKRDENFQKTMEVARDYGKQANDLAKESVKKDAQK